MKTKESGVEMGASDPHEMPKETIAEGKNRFDIDPPKAGFLQPGDDDLSWLDETPCDSDIFTSENKKSMDQAKMTCIKICPLAIATKCLKRAFDTQQRYDVLGAFTPSERKSLYNREEWKSFDSQEKNDFCRRAISAIELSKQTGEVAKKIKTKGGL
jgi:hypothetical protein